MTHRSDARASRDPASAARAASRRAAPGHGATADDRFFRHIVSSMRNGVLAIHRDGTLALMNDDAYRIFSLAKTSEDVGRPFSDVLRGRLDVARVLASAFELSHLPNRAELRLKDLNRVIGYTLSQVKDDHGRAIGAVLFFKDLTQVEQLEERERLRDRLASLGEMAAGMAHELRNPLAGIEVMAGLLRRQVPDSVDTQTLLADIISEAKLANAIVVEMLEFVRPVRLQVEQTDLADVLNQAVTLAESKASRGSIEVTVGAAGDLPMIDGDHHQLSQVFINLIANAFEALDGKGRVAISASIAAMDEDPAFTGAPSAPTPVVIVEVADDGPGIAADLRDRIFNPFFTTKPQGSGLGLAIVRKIVDAHDGRIDLISSPQAGTRFRITIPVTSTSGWFK
jgi:two-component system, NtrC family, sensor histidine kinase AtoS